MSRLSGGEKKQIHARFMYVKKQKLKVSPAVVVVDHSVNTNAVTHLQSQDHCEKSRAEKRPCLHPGNKTTNVQLKKMKHL